MNPHTNEEDHWFRDMVSYGPMAAVFPVIAIIAIIGILAGLILPALSAAKRKAQAQVVVYAAQDQVYAEPILREFEKETGTKVRAVYDSEAVKTVGLANRLLAERTHPQCDLFWGNEEMRTRQLAAQGAFRETNGWAAFGYRSRRIVINTNFVSAANSPSAAFRPPSPRQTERAEGSVLRVVAPTSLLDLTNETWRGKIAFAFPQFGTTAAHFHALRQHWGEQRWLAWCRALAANTPFVVDGNSVVVKLVARGEAWIGLTDSDDIAAGQREGLPIAALDGGARSSARADLPQGGDGARGVTRSTSDLMAETLLIPNTVAVIRNAPHPANAQRLFDFLQRREVAEKLVEAEALESSEGPEGRVTRVPNSTTETTDGDSHSSSLREQTLKPDWDTLLRDLQLTTKQLNEIFLR